MNFPADEVAHIDRHFHPFLDRRGSSFFDLGPCRSPVLDHTPLVGASGARHIAGRTISLPSNGLFSSGLLGGFANETELPKVWQEFVPSTQRRGSGFILLAVQTQEP